MEYTPGVSTCPPPRAGAIKLVGVSAFRSLYAESTSEAQVAVAPSPACICPFTFPKKVLEPLLVPTFPVSREIPELLTAPSELKSTYEEEVPRAGACA